MYWYGLLNATDLWQPVDAGYTALIKVLMEQAHRQCSDSEEKADRWYGKVD